MLKRFKMWAWLVAIALTQGVINTFLVGLWWVITGRGSPPDPDEPFSARVGRGAIKGKLWALLAEQAIDNIFGKGHCRNSKR